MGVRGELYVSPQKFKDFRGIDDEVEDSIIEAVVAATSEQIEEYCDRGFGKQEEASSRLYSNDDVCTDEITGDAVLLVDDIYDTAELVVETAATVAGPWTVISAAGYELRPLNDIADGKPVTEIRFVNGVAPDARTRVTAKWGWPKVPERVSFACKLQVARLFKRKEAPFGVTETLEGPGMRLLARLDPDVEALLFNLRRSARRAA